MQQLFIFLAMFRLYLQRDYIIFPVTCTMFIGIVKLAFIASSFDNIVLDITDYIQKLNDYICVVISCLCYVSLCYIKQTILRFPFLTKIDLSTWVADSFLVILLICPTRIMSWPATMGVSIKVIIERRSTR